MNTQLIVIGSIVLGLLCLFFVLAVVFSNIRRNLEKIVQERFSEEEIIVVTTRSNYFGIKSLGGSQVRGNAALVLTRDAIYSIRAVPKKEFKIAINSIRSVSMPRSFNGKSVLVPLLCVNFDTENGEDDDLKCLFWA